MSSTLAPSPRAATRPTVRPAPPADPVRAERDHWMHDFRNALGNTTIAASAVRSLLAQDNLDQVDMLMRQIEEGCERCMRLLGTMPR